MTTLTDIAIRTAQIIPRDKIIKNSFWISLSLLYDDLVKENEILPIEKLSNEDKSGYWGEVCGFNFDKWKKVSICRALYVFDLIRQI